MLASASEQKGTNREGRVGHRYPVVGSTRDLCKQATLAGE